MNSIITKTFPYTCAHLWYYLRVENLTGEEIQNKVREINVWLNDTCIVTCVDWVSHIVDGKYPVLKKEQWHWARKHSRVPMHHNLSAAPGSRRAHYYAGPCPGDWNEVSLSNSISFMNKEDLLALKLKFGITDNGTHPDMMNI